MIFDRIGCTFCQNKFFSLSPHFYDVSPAFSPKNKSFFRAIRSKKKIEYFGKLQFNENKTNFKPNLTDLFQFAKVLVIQKVMD